MSVPLAGSLPVIPTPFYEGRIDYESLDRLLAFLQPHLEGYTIGGSTGESVSLTLEERIELDASRLPKHARGSRRRRRHHAHADR